jgi:hypothetical protein
MARNITGTYTTGLTLTNAGDNPVGIASGANIANATGIGLQSALPVYWSVTNAANASISGNTFGVSLANAGIFTNSGHITSSYSSGSGFLYSTATHGFTVLSAALFQGGGVVSNTAGGVISGGVEGVALGQAGTVINAGSIGATVTKAGFGVALAAGGVVSNAPGGVISATDYGVFSNGPIALTNQANATITGASRGIFAINGNAIVNNQGLVSGGFYGARLSGSGGTVTNQGTMTGGYEGILISGAPGTVTNLGLIQNQISATTQTFAFGGVLLVAGGSLNNGAGGVIKSTSYGALVYGAAGTVTNSGTITSSRTQGGAGAALLTGGSLTNNAGGIITSEWIGIQSGPFGSSTPSAAAPATFDNSGAISAADGKGDGAAVWVHGPGVVINRAGGVIEGSTNGTVVGGPLNGLLNGGFGVVAYYQTTLINYGSIGGARYAFDAAGTSPTVGNRIEMAPGASFGGVVLGAHSAAQANLSTLELLSGASVGTVTGFGTQYKNFGNIAIDNGAQWNLGGTVSAATNISFAGTGALTLTNPASILGTINGVAAGDTLSLAGIIVTGSSFSNGVLTLTEASGSINLNIPGTFIAPDFAVTNGAGGATISVVGPNLLGGLSINQQLELIYIAYFNRSADGGGFTFWAGQNAQAQNAGQSAAVALTNIANSFTPQPETIALYPFLGTPNINLNTPEAQAGLTTFINSLYGNLFGHAPDGAGQAYWVGQITTGAVGLGAAALAIANGATGGDAIEVSNKIAVALDFTTRTAAAGLGEAGPLASSYLTAARNVLSGVDATSLNDASVTAGMNATTAFIAGWTTGHANSLVSSDAPITISMSNSVLDPGVGNHTIQFLTGAGADTLVLHAGGLDQISGFDPSTDVLDLRSLLTETSVDLNGNIAALGNYLTIADQGGDALVRFAPNGQGGATTVAVLQGSGGTVTNLDSLISRGAIRIS